MSKKVILTLSVLTLFFAFCKKDSPKNPFDEIVTVQNTTPDFGSIPAQNFAALHETIFKPTCANSGCHDGTFEPEFRTISSSYNSLVNHPVISNDSQNSYQKRVAPGSFNESLLYARLTEFLPNTSGIMPLSVDEESTWNQNSETYINDIRNWITAGAPDMFGNLAGTGATDFPPTIDGLLAFPAGQTDAPYTRNPDAIGITPILVDATSVDIWVKITDDNLNSENIPFAQLSFAPSVGELDELTASDYQTSSSISALDFSGSSTTFFHKQTIDLSPFSSGEAIYLRNYLNDGVQPENTLIPSENSSNVITSLFVLKIL